MRKNNLLFFASWLLALLAFTGCAPREIANEDSQGKSIICFGDSLTFGYGVNPGQDYPTMLSKLLDMPVLNRGVDGDTTEEGLKRLQKDVLDCDPRLVIIEFGGNDFLKKVQPQETIGNITKMIDQIQAKGAMVAVVDVSAGLILKVYRSGLYRLALNKKAIFVSSVFEGIITNPRLKSDFLHPNAAGYKLIARRVYWAILPYLNN